MVVLNTLQYNVFARSPRFLFSDKHETRLAKIPEFILDTETKFGVKLDVMALCEANEMGSVAMMIKTLKRQGFRYNSNVLGYRRRLLAPPVQSTCRDIQVHYRGSFTIDVINGGVIILSRDEIVSEVNYIFKNYMMIGYACDGLARKGFVYVKLRKILPNKRSFYYHVVATHLQAWPGKDYDKIRRLQISEIKEEIAKLNIPPDEPILYHGDFNVDYLTNKREVARILRTLKGTIPKLLGSQIFTSDPSSNYFVGRSGEHGSDCSVSCADTSHKLKCFNHILKPSKLISKIKSVKLKKQSSQFFQSFDRSLIQILKKATACKKKEFKKQCNCCDQELIDYIFYSSKKPKRSSIKVLLTKSFKSNEGDMMELSDHYPVLGSFEY